MSDLLETKVTRTEFLDLILDDMMAELEAQRDAIDKRVEAVPKVDLAAFLELIPAKPKFHLWDGDGAVSVEISFKVSNANLPKAYVERRAALEALEKEREPVLEKLRKLRDGKARARIELIRRSLEGSADGRALLAQADALKLKLNRKLLAEASR